MGGFYKQKQKKDDGLREQAEVFERLFSGDWCDYISATAGQSIHTARQNKPRVVPACVDIEKGHHLLQEKVGAKDYATLGKATLCSISLFNRKRGGEVQRIKIEDFHRGLKCAVLTNPEMLQGLTETEKKLINHFSRIEIREKFNRKGPELLTAQMTPSIQRILQLRIELQPPIESPYLFAFRSGERPYRGPDVIEEYAKEAGVTDGSIFTFTQLRKQVATLSQTLHISKWEQDQLATFLGHDIRVHRSVYRQPIEVMDRAKVAKILLSVNKGITISKENLGVVDEELDDEDGGNSSDEENDIDAKTDATADSDTASERGATQSESADIHAMRMRKKQSLTKR